MSPAVGAEIKKTRPVLVISNDINNALAPLITVLPIGNIGKKIYPMEIYIKQGQFGLKKDSKVRCQQIRTVDKQRLVQFIGKVDPAVLEEAKDSLLLHLGFIV